MNGFSSFENNASIRGYILRCLVKGHHFSYTVKGLSNKMMSCGLITTPEITPHLYYLVGSKLIEFTCKDVDAFNAMEKDAVVRLTPQGIRFIEQGGNDEMGIDL